MVNTISVNSQPLDLAKKYVNTDAPVDLFRKMKKNSKNGIFESNVG